MGGITCGFACFSCHGAATNEECNAGPMEVCRPDSMACENEVRVHHGKKQIFKRGKQEHACRNHVKLSYQLNVMEMKKTMYADAVVPAICVTKPNVFAARDVTSTKLILLSSWTLQVLSRSRTSTQ